MTHYSPEFKAGIIAKMLPPQSRAVPALAQETGISKDTLYRWRTLAVKADPAAAPAPSGAHERSSAQKFAVVLATSALDAAALSAYCRAQGLYPQQVEAWRTAGVQANTPVSDRIERAHRREDQQRITALTRELAYKEKALAETAALLVLQKKVRALFMDPADGSSTWSNDAP
jgi:transposase-like protein